MTELEKAACYVQLLKQEGKLDEAALPELIAMYKISREEAIELVESYKDTEAYKLNVTTNLKEKGGQIIVAILVGCAFLYISFTEEGFNFSSAHAVISFLSAIGALIYTLKLLKEKYGKNKGLLLDKNRFVINEHSSRRTRNNTSWINNKAIPVCLILVIILFYEQKDLENKSYLLQTREYENHDNLILSADCTEKTEGRKIRRRFMKLK